MRTKPSVGSSSAVGPRLLDYENPATADLEEASHWRQVYSELVAFTEEALRLTREAADGREDAGNPNSDLQLVTRQLERLRGRLEFWNQRARRLAPQQAAPVA